MAWCDAKDVSLALSYQQAPSGSVSFVRYHCEICRYLESRFVSICPLLGSPALRSFVIHDDVSFEVYSCKRKAEEQKFGLF